MVRWLLPALLLSACSNNGNSGSGFTSDEQTAFDEGAPGVTAVVNLAAVADSFFQFDPTLDKTQTDTGNAQLVHDHLLQNLGAVGDGGTSCGSVSISGATVTANFGPPPGCTLKTGTTLSGTIAVTLSKTGTSLAAAFQFTSAVVNGTAVSGTATLTTGDDFTFTVAANMTWGTASFSTSALTIQGSSGAVTFNGAITNTADATTTLTLSSVVWNDGACYPSSGSLAIAKGPLTETVTFAPTTATTGAVTVTVDNKTVNASLPSYGPCGGDAG